ncbi:MAG: ornithine cyclodeaminase family protein [Pseudomonadota bacterium]
MDVIDAQTVARLTPMQDLMDAIGEQLQSKCVSPARQAYALTNDASLLIMPAWETDSHIGVKLTHVDTERRPAVMATYLLMDAVSGRPVAMLDGAVLTARRTAAASGLAADILAHQDSKSLLIIGTGTLCPLVAEAYAAIRDLKQITIWGRSPDKVDQAVEAVRPFFPHVRRADDLKAAAAAADIISCVTSASEAFLSADMIRPGTHLDLIGAFRPDMAEADPPVFKAATVFVDTLDGALSEAGDLMQAIEAGALTEEDIVTDLAGLRSGYVRRDEEITLFKSVGMALEDLAAATLVYSRFVKERADAS